MKSLQSYNVIFFQATVSFEILEFFISGLIWLRFGSQRTEAKRWFQIWSDILH